MTTYVIMRTRIADELVNEPITTAQINNAILSAIKHYERRPLWFNTRIVTFSTIAATEYYESTTPSDFENIVTIDSMLVGTTSTDKSVMRGVENSVVEDNQDGSVTGKPYNFSRYANKIRLYPIPDAAYTVTMSYVYKLATLSADGDTNSWLTDGEELIRQSAKRILALDILHADDLGARCVTREREAYDEILAENRRRRPTTLLNMPAMPNADRSYNINRGY